MSPKMSPISNFNPRAHGGHDDLENEGYEIGIFISIHVPTGGTTYFNIAQKRVTISIHVPTGGTTS